jgi:hypothetical protein
MRNRDFVRSLACGLSERKSRHVSRCGTRAAVDWAKSLTADDIDVFQIAASMDQ